MTRTMTAGMQVSSGQQKYNKADLSLAHEIVERMDDIIFAKYTGENFTKRQLDRISGLVSCIRFHCDDNEKRDELIDLIEIKKRYIEDHLKKLTEPKASPTLDDDIPF